MRISDLQFKWLSRNAVAYLMHLPGKDLIATRPSVANFTVHGLHLAAIVPLNMDMAWDKESAMAEAEAHKDSI